jgi:hypothetical protein
MRWKKTIDEKNLKLNRNSSKIGTIQKKKRPSFLRRFEYKIAGLVYAFPAAAIKFKAEPATNQPI